MKRRDLEVNGILISDEPAREGALPQHVENVRTSLLDFTWTVLDGVNGDTKINSVNDDLLDDLAPDAAARHTLNQYKSIRDDAKILYRGQDREAEWATFFLINFFRPLVVAARINDGDTRQ